MRLLEKTGYAKSYQERFFFLGITARCGSTLLCQIFQETQACIAYAEPGIAHDLHIFTNKMESSDLESKDTKNYIKYSFMLLCKPVKGRNIVAHVMKFQPACSSFIQYLHGLFPDSRALFSYRHMRGFFGSYLKIATVLPIFVVIATLRAVNYKAYYNFLVSNGHRPPGKREYFASLQKLLTQRESEIFLDFCIAVADYLKAREQGCPIAGVRYEDLVAEPRTTLVKVFQHCHIPLELVARGLSAMERDSHKGSPLDQQNLVKHKNAWLHYQLSEDHQQDLKTLCQAINVPDLLHSEVLPGTL